MEDLSRRYEEHHRASRDGGDFVFVPERIPFLVAAVGGPGHRVLDLGCRAGAVSRHFLPGNSVVGLDVDRSALRRAAALGIETVVADAEEELPFFDASFDAVVAGELLEHLRDPDAVVAEAIRVLRPGGVLTGSVPNAYRLKSRLLFLAGRSPEDDPTHLQLFSPGRIGAMLSDLVDVRIGFVGGRLRRLGGRLFARDMVFAGRVPAGVAATITASHGRRVAA
jgi:SAM-dependent methyltransferase